MFNMHFVFTTAKRDKSFCDPLISDEEAEAHKSG